MLPLSLLVPLLTRYRILQRGDAFSVKQTWTEQPSEWGHGTLDAVMQTNVSMSQCKQSHMRSAGKQTCMSAFHLLAPSSLLLLVFPLLMEHSRLHAAQVLLRLSCKGLGIS